MSIENQKTSKTATLPHAAVVLHVEWTKCDTDASLRSVIPARLDMQGTTICERVFLVLWCEVHSTVTAVFSASSSAGRSDENVE
jgi:hypothetical protein